jgi:HK97 gp10 family phage protein
VAKVEVKVNEGEIHAYIMAEGTKAITIAALACVNRAKSLCPVDTGRLRDSITWQMGMVMGLPAARIGTDVEYAPYVELGTRYMAAQPFLRPALAAIAAGQI